MDPSDRNLVLAALDTATNPPETLSGLAKYLVTDGIFTEDFVSQHSKEILGIWRDWRQRTALSPPDSSVGGRQDEADSNSPTGRLALYGPVDDQVALHGITLFRPHHGMFGFAHSRRSEGAVSFIREETVKFHKLESEDDGTVCIQWRYAGRAADEFEDPNDQRVHFTSCVVLSADDVKEVVMTVDVVFGTSCFADLDQQRSHIPPPRCPTPPRAPSSDMDQLDGPATPSFGDADGPAQQMVPTVHPGGYQPTRPSHADPSPLVINANQVFVFNNTQVPLELARQIASSTGNQGLAPSARTAASSTSESQAVGGASKRKADADSQGFGRAKRFHG
ncbi:hypothetical protein F5883DRAFT_518398 [Diaporthe sp. PMI_573]|nr:hypothetical protein F5883DRAFT_518398 [Diaporthaceae sp. PMI_573]